MEAHLSSSWLNIDTSLSVNQPLSQTGVVANAVCTGPQKQCIQFVFILLASLDNGKVW